MDVNTSSAYRHAVHYLREPDEFAQAISGGSLTAEFLAPQAQPTRVEQFQSPGWAFDFHQAHVKARVRCPLPAGWASVGLMRTPSASTFHGFAVTPGMLVCNPHGEAIDGCIAPGFDCAAVSVPSSIWEKCRVLAGVERVQFGSVAAIRLTPRGYARLEQTLQATQHALQTASTPDEGSLAAHAAESFATELITTAWELSSAANPLRDSLRNRARLARRAEAWMRDRLAETVRIPDVCLELGVSRRELEYAFRSTFGVSPREFIHVLRLNAIRRALLREGGRESVIHVAFEYGIQHPGRFSAHYRALFGEYPAETRKSRARFPKHSPGEASLSTRT